MNGDHAPPPLATTAQTPPRRGRLAAGIIALIVVLVLVIVGAVWWVLSRGADEAGSPVQDIDVAPEITWTFQLPDGAENLQWSPVGDDRAVVSSSIVVLSAPTPVYMIDVTTGEQLWELAIDEPAQAMEAYWLSAKDLLGTDHVAVNLYPADESPSTMLLVNRETGAVEQTLEIPYGSAFFAAPSGNYYLVDWMNSRMSRLNGLEDLTDTMWTTSVPAFEGGDFAFDVVEQDGYALLGRAQGMGELPGYDWPLYFVAANVEDGTTPPWAPSDSGQSSFTFIDDVIVQLEQGETTVATGVDHNGEQLWHLDNFRGVVMPLGNMMFVIDHQDGGTTITRYDPATGSSRWDSPAQVPLGSVLTQVDGRVVALASGETPQAVTINETTGALGHQLTFPTSSQSRFFVGTDRLYVAVQAEYGSDVVLIAQPVTQPGSLWTKEFPSQYTVAQVGRHLVLIDHDNYAMSGLGVN